MADVTAAMVKQLRDKSGAGMMDCKRALTEAGGEIEAAIDWLRKKGLATAAKKAGRIAAEGLVAAATDGGKGIIIELNSETDFVARNTDFQELVGAVARVALGTNGHLDSVAAATTADGRTVSDRITDLIGEIGENLVLRRTAAVSVGRGTVSSYIHNAAAPGLGRIGVLVGLESEADSDALDEFGRKLAMHIAAANPSWLSRDDVDAASIEREHEILREQARSEGKPEQIVEKMVEGRMRKYFEEVCLLDQTYVIDGESRVSAAVEAAAAELASPVTVAGFVRYQLGEGVERAETDFAAEVAAAGGGRG